MKLLALVLCNKAVPAENGLFNLEGAPIGGINTPEFPLILNFTAFVLVASEITELGPHTLRVTMLSGHGREELPLDVDFEAVPGNRLNAFGVSFGEYQVEKPGEFSVNVSVDGSYLGGTPLQILLSPPSTPAPPA